MVSGLSQLFPKSHKPYPETLAKLMSALQALDSPTLVEGHRADARVKYLESVSKYLQSMKTHCK